MAGKSLQERSVKPKTAAQIARAELNNRLARERTEAIARNQRYAAENRKAMVVEFMQQERQRAARAQLVQERADKLVERAFAPACIAQFSLWLKINRLEPSPGTAARFFARYPELSGAPKQEPAPEPAPVEVPSE